MPKKLFNLLAEFPSPIDDSNKEILSITPDGIWYIADKLSHKCLYLFLYISVLLFAKDTLFKNNITHIKGIILKIGIRYFEKNGFFELRRMGVLINLFKQVFLVILF
jgi:hypothetical protein